MRKTFEELEGESIPKGYGVAYWEPNKMVAIIYPIPFNVIISLLRRIWIWFLYGHNLYNDGYWKGYLKGQEEGRKYAFNQYKAQVVSQFLEDVIERYEKERDKVAKKILSLPDKDRVKYSGWIWGHIDKEKKRLLKTK